MCSLISVCVSEYLLFISKCNSCQAKMVLVVKFVHDRCTIHDLFEGDIVIASGNLCYGLYKLIGYGKCVNDSACVVQNLLFQMLNSGMLALIT